MNQFFNWHDTFIVAQHNIWWILLAAVIGFIVGWRTCDMSASDTN